MIQKILQDIKKCYKNSKKKYCDESVKSKNKTKTTWKIMKKEIGNNNCQNDIKSIKINSTIMNNPLEIANTFNDFFLNITDTVIGNIKKDNSDSKDNMSLSNFLINNFKRTFPRTD